MDQAVSRALGILEALTRTGAPLRLARLTEQVGLQKSTTHRILQSLIVGMPSSSFFARAS